jgi:hypothetical protein
MTADTACHRGNNPGPDPVALPWPPNPAPPEGGPA